MRTRTLTLSLAHDEEVSDWHYSYAESQLREFVEEDGERIVGEVRFRTLEPAFVHDADGNLVLSSVNNEGKRVLRATANTRPAGEVTG